MYCWHGGFDIDIAWQMYTEIHLHIYALTETYGKFLIQDFHLGGARHCGIISQENQKDLCFVFLSLFPPLTLQFRFPAFPSLRPSDLVWLVVWWCHHKEEHCLAVTPQSPFGLISILCFHWVIPRVPPLPCSTPDSCCCHLSSREVILIIFLVVHPPFHLAFHGKFLPERNIPHTGYRLVSCWLLEMWCLI